uniref:Uncharacterized protein n=1 Tax=Alexandrium catenella TaxID=2925 RepID=A0A7S1RK68_ALECA|mmetsp:Transcript_61297/g.164018  ORF Transcript_61297/g.164018 Transcript_61297/m.164018 type:complete len:202 (+) Transcript_61297:69-674(+)|eukprot:CAMPEP_0171248010 /NCGR_PEP_ID=MMETSP0790-20130122/48796_1 /TAXON_ID=2925 /ORGANISM="Alexandrium catenella, Strain OF101" /LENGTH=201 /DNA_ID=CAMNT_0011715449 /DNA_START=69 /DNA_END=674 /DNA_ORIENTATION=+
MGGKGSYKGSSKGLSWTKGGSTFSRGAPVGLPRPAPWVKQSISKYPERPASKGKNGSKGQDSWYSGSKGKGKGKDKGKGKGKFRAAPLNSKFWERKVEEENREELGGVYSGTVQRYLWKGGWGFIAPDSPDEMPRQVKDKQAEAQQAAEKNGKEWTDADLIYFRKPDVNHAEGFKLTEGVAVTFSVYVDDKGAGAYEVTAA